MACCCNWLPIWSLKCNLMVEYGSDDVLPRLGRGRSTVISPGSLRSIVILNTCHLNSAGQSIQIVVSLPNWKVSLVHMSVRGITETAQGCNVMIARFLKACRGEVLPGTISSCGGHEIVMSEMMSFHFAVVSGCDHKSSVFVASSQVGMGSMGISNMSAWGPAPLVRMSR